MMRNHIKNTFIKSLVCLFGTFFILGLTIPEEAILHAQDKETSTIDESEASNLLQKQKITDQLVNIEDKVDSIISQQKTVAPQVETIYGRLNAPVLKLIVNKSVFEIVFYCILLIITLQGSYRIFGRFFYTISFVPFYHQSKWSWKSPYRIEHEHYIQTILKDDIQTFLDAVTNGEGNKMDMGENSIKTSLKDVLSAAILKLVETVEGTPDSISELAKNISALEERFNKLETNLNSQIDTLKTEQTEHLETNIRQLISDNSGIESLNKRLDSLEESIDRLSNKIKDNDPENSSILSEINSNLSTFEQRIEQTILAQGDQIELLKKYFEQLTDEHINQNTESEDFIFGASNSTVENASNSPILGNSPLRINRLSTPKNENYIDSMYTTSYKAKSLIEHFKNNRKDICDYLKQCGIDKVSETPDSFSSKYKDSNESLIFHIQPNGAFYLLEDKPNEVFWLFPIEAPRSQIILNALQSSFLFQKPFQNELHTDFKIIRPAQLHQVINTEADSSEYKLIYKGEISFL